MTNYEVSILKKALLKIEGNELNYFKNLPDENVQFSEEFENDIHKLAKKRKTFLWQATKTVPRKIAVVFIAAIVTFCMLMSISAIRIPVINFFVNIYEEFIHISVDKKENAFVHDSIESVAIPTYMIDGYSLEDSQNYGKDAETYWINSYGDIIILYQGILDSEFQVTVDNKNIDYQKEEVNGLIIYFTIENQYYQLLWAKNGYIFSLNCAKSIPFNDIKQMIISIP